MTRKISISRKFLLNSLVILSIIFCYSIYLFFKENTAKNNQIISDLSMELSFAEKSFDNSTKYVSLILSGIASEINKNPKNTKYIADTLRHYRILHEDKIKNILSISMFSWVDKNDKLIASSEIGIATNFADMSSRDYLKMTKKEVNKLYFGKPVIGAVSSQSIIPAGMGVASKYGVYQGSIIMGFNVEGVYQKFLQNRASKEANLQVIYDDEVSLINVSPNFDKKYLSKIDKNNFGIQILKSPTIFSSSSILIYKKIADTPYGFLINFNNLDGTSIIIKTFLLELLSITLCFALLIYLLRKNFIIPIAELSRKAELIAAGDKNTDIPESNIIEISQLYKAIILIKEFIKSEAELKNKLYAANVKLQSLAGFIGHEVRNSLGVIRLAQNQIRELVMKENGSDKNGLLELTSQVSNTIVGANNIVNIVLSDLREKPIDPADFSYLEASKILPETIKKFGYNSEAEKLKVKLNITAENNFIFKAIETRFTMVVHNLLKNALYYLKDYPNSAVTISTEIMGNGEAVRGPIDYNKYNVIYVYDTGPGIPDHIISKLFDDFFTFGKKDGTGLGLAFCKRNMQIFDGDIIVESEFGQNGKNGWTKFSLLFPKLSDEEIEKSIIEGRKRKILIVDDREVNLATAKVKIENALGQHIVCDIARNGFEAIKMTQENKYHLILMDVQMPEISGAETAQEIRRWNKDIPIIAYSSLDKKSFLKEIDKSLLESDFNYYLNKAAAENILFRTIFKWIIDLQDDFSYLGIQNEYIGVLKGRKAIIADDQQTIRKMIKVTLENYGMQISEAVNGKELVEIYKNSLNQNGKSSFDIIMTDINMPHQGGDEAAKEIRKIEASHDISHHDEITIIALSGDGKKEDIHHFFECQITDYFIKGDSPELLLKMIASYLIKKADNDSKTHAQLTGTEQFLIINNNLAYLPKEDRNEILKLFLEDGPDIMVKIKESAKEADTKKVLFYIHMLKGNAAGVGTERLYNYIKAVEPMLANMPGNVSLSDDWLKKLEVIYDGTEIEVKKWMSL